MAYKKNEIEKLFTEICKLISEKGLSLRQVLQHKSMPDKNTFYKWIDELDGKKEQYARAREERADLMFEDILHIADDTSRDTQTVDIGGIEIEQINHDAIQRSRLRVDSRKWMLSKMNPNKYGDKMNIEMDSTPTIKVIDVSNYEKK